MKKSNFLQPILIRSQVIRAVRHFFENQGFDEVITPVFNTALPLEPTLYSFKSQWHRLTDDRDLYLTVSPESGLKKMLAQGLGNCFSIGKCFRNLENSGSRHHPEFLMLEWYRVDADYHQIMADTRELVLSVKKATDKYLKRSHSTTLEYKDFPIELGNEWPKLSLIELFKKHADIDIEQIIEDKKLIDIAKSKGYNVENTNWGQLFDQIFLNEIEPHLSSQPFFLVDFPARISPLCQVKKDQPFLAERFEVYMANMEIGNGNNENIDAEMVANSFAKEEKFRQQNNEPAHPIDQKFIQALESMQNSGNHYAGIGLGIDRLAMLMANTDNIDDVEPFGV